MGFGVFHRAPLVLLGVNPQRTESISPQGCCLGYSKLWLSIRFQVFTFKPVDLLQVLQVSGIFLVSLSARKPMIHSVSTERALDFACSPGRACSSSPSCSVKREGQGSFISTNSRCRTNVDGLANEPLKAVLSIDLWMVLLNLEQPNSRFIT